jgi:hypothetical protein
MINRNLLNQNFVITGLFAGKYDTFNSSVYSIEATRVYASEREKRFDFYLLDCIVVLEKTNIDQFNLQCSFSRKINHNLPTQRLGKNPQQMENMCLE